MFSQELVADEYLGYLRDDTRWGVQRSLPGEAVTWM